MTNPLLYEVRLKALEHRARREIIDSKMADLFDEAVPILFNAILFNMINKMFTYKMVSGVVNDDWKYRASGGWFTLRDEWALRKDTENKIEMYFSCRTRINLIKKPLWYALFPIFYPLSLVFKYIEGKEPHPWDTAIGTTGRGA